MRAVLGLVSLLIVVAVVGWLAKQQATPLPTDIQTPASTVGAPPATPQQQRQTLQDQVKKSVEEAMQSPRGKESQ